MNPIRLVSRPVKDVYRAVTVPLQALFVIGLTGFINWMTYSGVWWFKWVAFGMGIAVLVAWARAAKTLLLLGLVAFVGWQIYKRWGDAARQRFEDWVARTQPRAAEVVDLWRSPGRQQAFGGGAGPTASR